MHPSILFMLIWAVGGLSKINESCSFVDDRSKTRTGTCQTKPGCLESGLAAISLNEAGDKLCAEEDDDSIHCCVDIKCGEHQCRNNVPGNPCATGTYLTNSRNHVYCPSPSFEDNIQCCVEKEMHHEIRAVQDYELWGFDTFDMPDSSDTYGDLGLGSDDTDLFGDLSFNDIPDFQLAQIPGGMNVDTTVDDIQGYQTLNMDTVPMVQDLEPVYEEYQPLNTLKTLKTSKNGPSYLPIDDFNDRLGPDMTVTKDRGQEDAWKLQPMHEATFQDGRNGGPGIATDNGIVVWNSHFEGPQMVWDLQP